MEPIEEKAIVTSRNTGRKIINDFKLLTVSKSGANIYLFSPKPKTDTDINSSNQNNQDNQNNSSPPNNYLTLSKRFDKATIAVCSPNGNLLALVKDTANNVVEILDINNNYEKVSSFDVAGPISKIQFSPLSSMLLILSKYSVKNDRNLVIFSIKSEKIIFTGIQKTVYKNSIANLMWSSNETYCCQLYAGELRIYKDGDMVTPYGKLKFDRLTSFGLSPENPSYSIFVLMYSSESKDSPAVVRILNLNDLNTVIVSQNFCRSQELTYRWSHDASAVLVLSHGDVDPSGKSYYGCNKLYYLRSDGSVKLQISSEEEGLVHDFKWNPTTTEFLVCKGSVPPELILYDGKTGKGILSYGKLKRNTIRWNKFGTLFLIGGFENFAGDVDIVHKKKKLTLGSLNIACTVECEFSEDCKHFFAATTNPRLRIDNCVKIFRYNGQLLQKIDFDELYSVCWIPLNVGGKPLEERDFSPIKVQAGDKDVKTQKSVEIYRSKFYSGKPGLSSLQSKDLECSKINITKIGDGATNKVKGPPGSPGVKISKSANRNARKKKAKQAEKSQLKDINGTSRGIEIKIDDHTEVKREVSL